jgi:hypothetical protein
MAQPVITDCDYSPTNIILADDVGQAKFIAQNGMSKATVPHGSICIDYTSDAISALSFDRIDDDACVA